MREPLRVAVVQPLCVPYDVTVNAVAHAATVRSAGARLVVFPELSATGYELDAPAAITAQDPRLAPIVEACAEVGRWRWWALRCGERRADRTSRCWPPEEGLQYRRAP